MPKVKPAIIYLRNGDMIKENEFRIEYGPQLLTTYTIEMGKVEKKSRFGKVRVVDTPVKVPIMSYSYSQISRIDWGYVDQKTYDHIKSQLDKAQKADESKKGDKGAELGNDGSTASRKSVK
jgi:hypothetical protein